MHAQRIVTISGADLHRANLLCMQSSHFIRHLATPDVPEPQSAVKVTGTDEVLISGAAHRVAAAVAHDGAQAVTLVEVPYLDGPICAAADSPQRGAWTAVHTAHLHKARSRVLEKGGKKFALFSNHNGSLLRRQPGARRVLTHHVYIHVHATVCSKVKHKWRKHWARGPTLLNIPDSDSVMLFTERCLVLSETRF